jgi:hypothetical protein
MNKTAHEAPLHRHIKTTLHHDRPLEERVRLLRGRRRGQGKQEGKGLVEQLIKPAGEEEVV